MPKRSTKTTEIKEFYEANGRLPLNKTEPTLYKALANRVSKGPMFDAEFAEWARARGYGTRRRGRAPGSKNEKPNQSSDDSIVLEETGSAA